MAGIRILQIFTIMNRGGAESMIMNYYRNIDRTKVQFDFLVHRKKSGSFDEEIKALGGKIYTLDPVNPFLPKKYYKAITTFFQEHPEYKIVHSHLNTLSYFPLKIAKENKIPIRIAHAHTALEGVKRRDFMVKFRLKNKIGLPTTHFFSCGEKAGNWLFGDIDFQIMNNAIDSRQFLHNPAIGEKLRVEFNLKNKTVVGHVGRFNSLKNHMYLLKVFASFLEQKPDSVLVLVGGGELKHKIVSEIERLKIVDNVLMLGVRKDISRLLQMFDIFVFPSFFEGLPVTLIEAQAAGLKIIASDTITQELQLTDNVYFLSIEEHPSVWATKITSILPYQKSDLSKVIIQGDYDIVANAKKIQNFYLEQING